MRFYFYFKFHVERTASDNSLSYHDTDSEQKLRKANKELNDEVAELKVKLEKDLFNLNIAFDTNQFFTIILDALIVTSKM